MLSSVLAVLSQRLGGFLSHLLQGRVHEVQREPEALVQDSAFFSGSPEK